VVAVLKASAFSEPMAVPEIEASEAMSIPKTGVAGAEPTPGVSVAVID
jgi:hypothetical protein